MAGISDKDPPKIKERQIDGDDDALISDDILYVLSDSEITFIDPNIPGAKLLRIVGVSGIGTLIPSVGTIETTEVGILESRLFAPRPSTNSWIEV